MQGDGLEGRAQDLPCSIRDFVGRGDGRRAGVVVVELPGRERAVLLRSSLDLNDAGWTEIRPGELFFARPNNLDRLAHSFGQTRRFDRGLAVMLAAVAG